MGRLTTQLQRFGEVYRAFEIRALTRQLEALFAKVHVDETRQSYGVTGDYTLTLADGMIEVDTSTAPVTITLPGAGEDLVAEKREFTVKKSTAGNYLRILPTGSDTIDYSTGVIVYNRGTSLTFRAVTGGWRIV